MSYSTEESPVLTVNLRKRRPVNKMGPQLEEDGSEMIPMVEQPAQVKPREDDEWRESDQSENEVLILPISKDQPAPAHKIEDESFWLITLQVFFPFLIAGLGMVGAGLVLDIVQASIIYCQSLLVGCPLEYQTNNHFFCSTGRCLKL